MKMTLIARISFLALLATSLSVKSQPAFADVELARLDVDLGRNGSLITNTPVSSVYFYFRVWPFATSTEETNGLWYVGPLTTADVGKTFVLDPSTASSYFLGQFDILAANLTNGKVLDGTGDATEYGINTTPGSGGAFGTDEHFAFYDNSIFAGQDFGVAADIFVPTTGDIDLHGTTINSISMKIDDLAFLNGGRLIRGAYTLSFQGTSNVPELASIVSVVWLPLLTLYRRRSTV